MTGSTPGNDTARAINPAQRSEVLGIFTRAISEGTLPANDRSYLAQLIAANTGMSQADAERRIDQVMAQAQAAKVKAQEKADEARSAAAKLAFWTFFALLAGAFAASYAATIGGRHREEARLAI